MTPFYRTSEIGTEDMSFQIEVILDLRQKKGVLRPPFFKFFRFKKINLQLKL